MPDKPKLIWHSNSPHVASGYGNQTALFTKRLKETHDVAISSFHGHTGNILPWEGMPIFPAIGDGMYGNETITGHAKRWFDNDPRSGLVFTLLDVWILDPEIWGQLNTACWTPIDMEPVAVPVRNFFRESNAIPVAMSQWGEGLLREEGFDPIYVPHAVDTQEYVAYDRTEARAQLSELGVEIPADCFLVGMVAANKTKFPDRKCFPEALAAFKIFHDAHPDAMLYLHTEPRGNLGGNDLPELGARLGLDLDSVIFPDPYRIMHFPYTPKQMAIRYSAMDCLLAPSMGEGWGIPTVEAQACGTPVIMTDFSAQTELCGSGWLVEPITRLYTTLGSWQVLPDIADIVDALERAYGLSEPQVAHHREKAREFAEQFDVETVLKDQMLPALEEIYARFGEAPPVEVEMEPAAA